MKYYCIQLSIPTDQTHVKLRWNTRQVRDSVYTFLMMTSAVRSDCVRIRKFQSDSTRYINIEMDK